MALQCFRFLSKRGGMGSDSFPYHPVDLLVRGGNREVTQPAHFFWRLRLRLAVAKDQAGVVPHLNLFGLRVADEQTESVVACRSIVLALDDTPGDSGAILLHEITAVNAYSRPPH